MNRDIRRLSIRTALAPLADHPDAAPVLADLDATGRVSRATHRQLVDQPSYRSHGEAVLFDLVTVLLGYLGDAPDAHPAQALQHLSGDWRTAYVEALTIALTG